MSLTVARVAVLTALPIAPMGPISPINVDAFGPVPDFELREAALVGRHNGAEWQTLSTAPFGTRRGSGGGSARAPNPGHIADRRSHPMRRPIGGDRPTPSRGRKWYTPLTATASSLMTDARDEAHQFGLAVFCSRRRGSSALEIGS